MFEELVHELLKLLGRDNLMTARTEMAVNSYEDHKLACCAIVNFFFIISIFFFR